MGRVKLVPHSLEFAQRIFELASAPPVRDTLGLPDESVDDTRNFIRSVIAEEVTGKSLSRVILNENDEVIGVTTLMYINKEKKRCHIGTWIGHEYWGQGYNQELKVAILKIAFEKLGLEYVFAGARKVNIRSQRAQEKLPFIRLHVEDQFPEELEALEKREKQPCVLHAFFKDDVLSYLRNEPSNH